MVTEANGIKESGLGAAQEMLSSFLAVRLHQPGGDEFGELRFKRGAVGTGESDSFSVGEEACHFASSISKRTMSASCFAVGSLPFNSPGSFDCKV